MSGKLEMPLEDFAVAVSKENERLRNILHHSGIVEIASYNNRVTEYMFHWEGRALDAEAKVEQMKMVLEMSNRVLHFDLRRMIEWGPDYNQAVKDAADEVRKILENIE